MAANAAISVMFGNLDTAPPTWPVSRLPRPGSVALAAVLTVALRRALPQDVYLQLIGRRVEIMVLDWHARFRFVVTPIRFAPLGPSGGIDLRISATARDFALLAAGEEDADTLYFDRRVAVEGDTELALLIKNTLDALPAKKTRQLIRALHHGRSLAGSWRARPGVFGRKHSM